MRRLLFVSFFMVLVAVVSAPVDALESRPQAEMAMVVTGSVDIEEDGTVSAYKLDKPELVPDGVVRVIQEAVMRWKFAPIIDGDRVKKARASVGLRIVARLVEGQLAVHVANFNFATSPDEWVTSRSLTRPGYPRDAAWNGIKGTVYVVARIGSDGKPDQVMAEQVNLTTLDHYGNADMWRKQLARAALLAARRWRFNLPVSGPYVEQPYWTVRVPVDFGGDLEGGYGSWQLYLPGPRQAVPWLSDEQQASSDAFVAGGVYPVGAGERRIIPNDV